MWIYEVILKPSLVKVVFVWGKEISKKTADATLEEMKGIVIKKASGAVRSKPTAALGDFWASNPHWTAYLCRRQNSIPDAECTRN